MNDHSPPNRPLLLTALTVLFLLGLSWIGRVTIGGVTTKTVDLLADVRGKKARKSPNLTAIPKVQLEDRHEAETEFKPRVIPKIDGEGLFKIEDFGKPGPGGLTPFLKALAAMKPEDKVRVAWFGDSTIEGDLITQDVRRNLQDTFGGTGVGFVPITSVVSKFRASILHSFSENWLTISLRTENPYRFPLGLSGYCFVPAVGKYEAGDASTGKTQSWVEYGVTDKMPTFDQVRIFYGFSKGVASVHSCLGDGPFNVTPLAKGTVIEEARLDSAAVRKARIFFTCDAPLAVYGACIENAEGGVFVDNYSFRGSNGFNLNQISDSVWKSFCDRLNYKLIVLEYGANIADPETKGFGWYERGLIQVLTRLRTLFPDTGILVVSAPDKSVHQDMEYVTNPAIPMIIQAQRNAAKKTGVAFWSLYDAMGGENSMPVWVERKYAAPDYTHLSGAGAREIARRLTKAILYEYSNYTNPGQ